MRDGQSGKDRKAQHPVFGLFSEKQKPEAEQKIGLAASETARKRHHDVREVAAQCMIEEFRDRYIDIHHINPFA
jgi:hypothetical protein